MDLTVIELRQYTLHPGRRDELIELFERELVEPQEAVGMTILGTFRDLDDPDRFVWLRGFRDMPTRKKALTAFYGGPVWAEHGPKANATMVDSSNARLLHPSHWSVPNTPSHCVTAELTTGRVTDNTALAVLTPLNVENDFPRLPVRTDPITVVLRRDPDPQPAPGLLRLAPTARSRIS
ncbi:NIPSNAP family protein [Actinomadura rudentiformis]|uniref:NIPSNAP family protein n=1 Tax=Actinomadura rudentiformis TaxID=359158 RepID=UPI001CEFAEFA|nr:NIPSNAP family protein [Actinomadura rudentiformis]